MDLVQHARAGAGKAGRPGVGPDVRAEEADVRGPGRMSGAWRLFLPSSIGSLLPWTWGLDHLHVHPREGPLGT